MQRRIPTLSRPSVRAGSAFSFPGGARRLSRFEPIRAAWRPSRVLSELRRAGGMEEGGEKVFMGGGGSGVLVWSGELEEKSQLLLLNHTHE